MWAVILSLSLLFSSQVSTSCIHDNCLRAFRAYTPLDRYESAVKFCSTFTQAPATATTSLPAFATSCANDVAKISSACSCMPTPIATSTACESLIQNGDFSEPVQTFNTPPPSWDVTYESFGDPVFYNVGNFNGPTFWTKWEGDNTSEPSERQFLTLSQNFTRCAGLNYVLAVEYNADGYISSGEPPITLAIAIDSFQQTFDIPAKDSVAIGDNLMMLIPPLASSRSGSVSITITDGLGDTMEMFIHNVSLIAVSS